MIDSRYDEDLLENSFFQHLKREYSDLIERATREYWIICVPRADSFQRSTLTEDDYLTHILIPNDELPETHYRTVSGKQVTLSNQVLTVEDDNLAASVCTHIIFEEVFYTEDFSKYKVWCIECPLNRNTFQYEMRNGSYNSVRTLRDCIDLLWTESIGKDILEQLDVLTSDFLVKYSDLEKCKLQEIKDVVSSLYAKCLQTALQDVRLRERTSKSAHLLDNVKISVESYMQHAIYKKLFTSISMCTSYDDSCFNKIVRNLYDIQLRDLNIKAEFHEFIPCAKRELAKINGYTTVLGKIGCLRHTFLEIAKFNASCTTTTDFNCLDADDLLQVFVFLVLKTNIPNWIANLLFLKQFQFSMLSNMDESSFLLTTLEAVIEHIRSGVLLGPSEPESQWQCSAQNASEPTKKIESNASSVAVLFEQIRLGCYDTVREILIQDNMEQTPNTRDLCHPLCSCDKCERLLAQNACDTRATVHSCDDRGLTALHIACMYGKPNIVELLLEQHANLQSCDYSGATPLHYAAMRGHQNALLLLLHSGADINAVDNEKMTALHLCCNNGHEACVKAMLYFAEHRASDIQVNAMNALGNTPLHYAARWGYQSIVQILLEYGADPSIGNKHRKTALDCAHNLKIFYLMDNNRRKQLVTVTDRKQDREENQSDLDLVEEEQQPLERGSSSEKEQLGIKPRSMHEMKKAELLLRAVAFGDVPLICYYLGLNTVVADKQEKKRSELCHPLCSCEQCESISVHNAREVQDINVCNVEGYTALHVACLHGRTEIVRLLLENGAILNIITRKGLSPLHLACQTQRHEIVRLLLQHKDCNVNLQDARGNTALHYTLYARDQRLAELLASHGADATLRNVNGKSPLDEAKERLMFGFVNILQRMSKFE